MKSGSAFIIGLLGLGAVNGFQCKEDETLKKYKITEEGGSVSGSVKRETPPSTTEEKWWINACAENDKVERPSDCNRNDVLCGLTYVSVPNKDTLLTQVIDFPRDLSETVEEIDSGVLLTWKGAKWGPETFDALVEYHCDDNMKTDEVSSTTWQDKQIRISVKGPSGCLIKKDDGNKDEPPREKDPKNNDKKGTSWFTWLLLYALLFTLIYLMVTAYVNTRGGSFQDFREEFIDRSTQLITSLPAFLKEVAARIFGSGSSQRGGYSAV